MIFVTGDTHGYLSELKKRVKPDGTGWTEEDTLIVCGDFGFVFSAAEKDGRYPDDDALDLIARDYPQRILCVSGNHENFDRFYAYPDVPFCGGTAKEIRKGKIYLLKRGEAYLIEGKRFFTFGGAFSTDKARRLAIERTYGGEKCWWERELPSPEEYRHAAETLKKYNYRFDCVITHNCPERVIYWMKRFPDRHEQELTGFLDWIYTDVRFDRWYFGHWHADESFDGGKIPACFQEVHALE